MHYNEIQHTRTFEACFTEKHEAARSKPWQCLGNHTMYFSVRHKHKQTIREYQVITTNTQHTYTQTNEVVCRCQTMTFYCTLSLAVRQKHVKVFHLTWKLHIWMKSSCDATIWLVQHYRSSTNCSNQVHYLQIKQ